MLLCEKRANPETHNSYRKNAIDLAKDDEVKEYLLSQTGGAPAREAAVPPAEAIDAGAAGSQPAPKAKAATKAGAKVAAKGKAKAKAK